MSAILRLTDRYPDIVHESFESSVGAWVSGGTNTLAISTAQSRFGDSSMLWTYVDNVLVASLDLTFTAGVHTFSGWFYIPSTFTGTVPRIRPGGIVGARAYAYEDSHVTDFPNVNLDTAIVDAWQFASVSFLPLASDLTGSIRVNIATGSAVDTMWIDGLKLEVSPYATDFVPKDEVTTVSLIAREGASGFLLNGIRPQTPNYKGGGSWAASPFSEGSKLIDAKFANIIETYDLSFKDISQDAAAASMRELRGLLLQADSYWTAPWQTRPVWIEAKATNETNSRYALIYHARLPDDGNHWGMPFLQPGCEAAMQGLDLVIERGPWLDKPPGLTNSTLLSAVEPYEIGDALLISSPQASTDDAQANHDLSTVTLGAAAIQWGDTAGVAETEIGIRFRGVEVANGATIKSAKVVMQASGTESGSLPSLISGELNPAVYSNYADFTGRTKTTATVSWGPENFTNNVEYETPDIKTIIQEIVDEGAWVQGGNIGIFIDWVSGTNDRQIDAWDGSTTTRPRLVIEIE